MKAYIFDFNGTMVMDSYMHETAWRHYVEVLCGRSVPDEEFIKHVHGKTSAMILEHFLGGKSLSRDEVMRYSEEKEGYYRKLCLEHKDWFHLTEGLVELLNGAKETGVPMAIATAANLANIDFYFEYFLLDKWFNRRHVIYDDGTLQGKPDPDIYLRAMETLAAEPGDCIVFEDAVSGVISAHRAGAGKIVGVYGDSSRELLEETGLVDLCVRDFREYNSMQ